MLASKECKATLKRDWQYLSRRTSHAYPFHNPTDAVYHSSRTFHSFVPVCSNLTTKRCDFSAKTLHKIKRNNSSLQKKDKFAPKKERSISEQDCQEDNQSSVNLVLIRLMVGWKLSHHISDQSKTNSIRWQHLRTRFPALDDGSKNLLCVLIGSSDGLCETWLLMYNYCNRIYPW